MRLAIAIVLSSILTLGAAERSTAAPIPAGPDAPVARDMLQQHLAFNRATLAQAYDRVGKRNPAWDDAAHALLEQLALTTADAPDRPTTATLLEAATELVVKSKCDDPLILYAYGYALEASGKTEANQALVDAADALRNSKYPAVRCAAAAHRCAHYIDRVGRRPADAYPYYRVAVDKWIEALRTNEFPKGQPRLVTALILGPIDYDLPADLAAAFAEQLRTLKDVDPWAQHTLLGVAEVKAAWAARGTKFANAVEENRWKGFNDHLAEAREHLTAAWKLDQTRPEPAAEMISVLAGGNPREDESVRNWFDRAVHAQLDYLPAYWKMVWALQPRWIGSHEEQLRFGLECKATGRYDTGVPYIYVSAIMEMADDPDGLEFWRFIDVYPDAEEVVGNWLAAPGHPDRAEDAARVRSLLAGIAYETGNNIAAGRLLQELGKGFEAEAVRPLGIVRRDIEDEALLSTSMHRVPLTAARRWFERGEYDRAYKPFAQTLPDLDDEPKTAAVARDRLEAARLMRALDAGEWAPITFGEGLPGWRADSGCTATGDAITSSGGVARWTARCAAPVGQRWELRGEIDVAAFDKNAGACCGVMMAVEDKSINPRFLSVALLPAEQGVALRDRLIGGQTTPAQLRPDTNTFDVKVWDGEVVFTVNDKVVIADDAPIPPNWNPGDRIGLFTFVRQPGAKATFRKLQVHRLDDRPAELKDKPQDDAGGKPRF